MPRLIPDLAVDLVARWEGFRSETYVCPAGVLTIGYGHTRGVEPGQRISELRARDFLRDDLERSLAALVAVIGEDNVTRLNDNQFAALLSFVFNVGASADWQIWKALRAGQDARIPAELARFTHAGGHELAGLVARRADEAAVWERPCASTPPPPEATVTVTHHAGGGGGTPRPAPPPSAPAWFAIVLAILKAIFAPRRRPT